MTYKEFKMKSVKRIYLWSENTASQQVNMSNSGNGLLASSWGNPHFAPPLVSMALDLVSTLQSTQGRTKV
tara:strand:+ start:1522 stop:1731 length:210 start_codon:yes stop_codon:yes gene_type:complete